MTGYTEVTPRPGHNLRLADNRELSDEKGV
jgi:hypothetical protein